jgi:hypothetical protein
MNISVNTFEINRALKNYMKVVSRTSAQALEEVGQRGVGIAKANSPVDSGRLRNSMGYSINNKVVSNADNANDQISPKSGKKFVWIGTNVVYAQKVEYLSKTGSAGFFQRAINQIKPMAKRVFEQAMRRGL